MYLAIWLVLLDKSKKVELNYNCPGGDKRGVFFVGRNCFTWNTPLSVATSVDDIA